MLRNYLITALRNLVRSKETAFINILGLAIGLAACLLIVMYVRFERSYDQFHSHASRIHRLLTIDEALGVSSNLVGITLPALGPAMETEIPEVTRSVRMMRNGRSLLDHEQRQLYTEDMTYVEPSFFEVFDFPWIEGEPLRFNALRKAVMTRALAQKMFGDASPLGKRITVNSSDEVEVVGVMENPPPNSHLQLDLLVSMVPSEQDSNVVQMLNSWGMIAMITYVELSEQASPPLVKEKMEDIIRAHDVGENFRVTLQPLTEAHLGSSNILFDAHNQNKTDGPMAAGLCLPH